jgi:hypothetical protein
MAGGSEDHFTDSRELYVPVEGDEWAHSIAWMSVPQAEPRVLAVLATASNERRVDREISGGDAACA